MRTSRTRRCNVVRDRVNPLGSQARYVRALRQPKLSLIITTTSIDQQLLTPPSPSDGHPTPAPNMLRVQRVMVTAAAAMSTLASLPTPPKLPSLQTPSDNAAARTWLAHFKTRSVPKEAVELSFARSSGPGGYVPISPPPTLRLTLKRVLVDADST